MFAAKDYLGGLSSFNALFEPAQRAHKLTANTLDQFALVHLSAADRFRKLNLERIEALHSRLDLPEFVERQFPVATAYSQAYGEYVSDLVSTTHHAIETYADLISDWSRPGSASNQA